MIPTTLWDNPDKDERENQNLGTDHNIHSTTWSILRESLYDHWMDTCRYGMYAYHSYNMGKVDKDKVGSRKHRTPDMGQTIIQRLLEQRGNEKHKGETRMEEIEKLKEENPTAKALLKSPRALMLFFKLARKLCNDCKVMVDINPQSNLDDYCERCRPTVEKTLKKAEKVMGKSG